MRRQLVTHLYNRQIIQMLFFIFSCVGQTNVVKAFLFYRSYLMATNDKIYVTFTFLFENKL